MIALSNYAKANFLDCELDNYRNIGGYNKDFALSWVPERQAHQVEGGQMIMAFPDSGFVSDKFKKSSDRLEWNYKTRNDDTEVDLRYIFFKTNNKLAVKVRFKGYNPLETVWGSCNLTQTSSQTERLSETEEVSVQSDSQKTINGDLSLNEAKAECKQIGFIPQTEKYGDCVMKLMGD